MEVRPSGCKEAKEKQIMLYRILALLSMVVLLSPAVGAGLVLSGGGLALVEEGPVAAAAGDAAPVNLATGADAFSSGDLGPEIGLQHHRASTK